MVAWSRVGIDPADVLPWPRCRTVSIANPEGSLVAATTLETELSSVLVPVPSSRFRARLRMLIQFQSLNCLARERHNTTITVAGDGFIDNPPLWQTGGAGK